MAEKEQVKPLAPLAYRTSSNEDEALSMYLKHRSRKRFILCCGCVAALLLILVVVILVLIFTVFQIEEPKISMNSVSIQRWEVANNGSLRTDVNVTLVADVSVKNPNVASFRFTNTTTEIYCGGVVMGEASHNQGVARARRTLQMNITVDLIPKKLLAVPSFTTDLNPNALNISSSTRIAGKVNILGILKKHITAGLNCTMIYNVDRKACEEKNCRPHLPL